MPKKTDEGVCGHVNKHFYNTDGQLEDLVCTLPVGHEPVLLRTDNIKDPGGEVRSVPVYSKLHQAEYEHKIADVIPPLKQRVEGKPIIYKVEKAVAEWTDAAGVPAPQ